MQTERKHVLVPETHKIHHRQVQLSMKKVVQSRNTAMMSKLTICVIDIHTLLLNHIKDNWTLNISVLNIIMLLCSWTLLYVKILLHMLLSSWTGFSVKILLEVVDITALNYIYMVRYFKTSQLVIWYENVSICKLAKITSDVSITLLKSAKRKCVFLWKNIIWDRKICNNVYVK